MIKTMTKSDRWMSSHHGVKGCYLKGVTAGRAGEPIIACPYNPDKHHTLWSAFAVKRREAWIDGWMDGIKQREDTNG